MKLTLKRLLLTVLTIVFVLSAGIPPVQAADAMPDALDFRAVWVSTVLNLDYPLNATTDDVSLKLQADAILDGAVEMGMNAVILQVRPASDALYKSDYFPWSKYLTGKAGTAPENDFDPLAYWVEAAHERGLELHAWINPYRITKNSSTDKITALSQLPSGHPAREHTNWAVKYEGDYYFDPGIPAVQDYIVDAAVEIVEKYDVDGIHLDDYFYPGTDFGDSATYKTYGKNYDSIADWRRNNVDTLIQKLDTELHKADPDVRFGVSPFGIWANKQTMAEGSNTTGGESYTQHYADTRKWVKLGWLDYIAPQIYWHIGHKSADYETLVKWWSDTVKGTDVDLYVGHAAYRVGAEGENAAWRTPAELVRQLTLNCDYPEVKGSIYFRYQFFAESASLRNTVTSLYRTTVLSETEEKGDYELAITWPEKDLKTTLSTYYVGGSSDASKPLYRDGVLVLNRSENGFFGSLVELEMGENKIVYTQGDKTVVRTITRVKGSSSVSSSNPPKADSAEITDMTPSSNKYGTSGTKVTLSCTAPIGAVVKATVGNKTYRLTPADKTAPDSKNIYTTTYSYTYTLPSTSSALNDLGKVRYDMTYGSTKVRQYSDGVLGVYSDVSKLQASFTSDVVYGYLTSSTSGGPYGELAGNMTDTVTAIKGNFVRTASNLYIPMSSVTLSVKGSLNMKVKSAKYAVESDGSHTVTISHCGGSGWAKYDNETRTLVFSVSPASDPVKLSLPKNSLFQSATAAEKVDRVTYTLVLKDDVDLNGYYCTSEDGKTTLHLIPKKGLADGAYPLKAHTIVIDPGHGGYEAGAMGLMGSNMPEKEINLRNALALKEKLESLGATVVITRDDDTRLSLEQRVTVSRELKPDLFISVHANSMSETTDISSVSGYSVYYRETISADAAQAVFDASGKLLDRPNVGVHQSNLYVGRGSWCPALIYETAFLPNPADFDWLMDPDTPNALADAIALGVLTYFGK